VLHKFTAYYFGETTEGIFMNYFFLDESSEPEIWLYERNNILMPLHIPMQQGN
jgi:hypothetical protein